MSRYRRPHFKKHSVIWKTRIYFSIHIHQIFETKTKGANEIRYPFSVAHILKEMFYL